MNKKELKRFEEMLLAKRAELVGDIGHLRKNAMDSTPTEAAGDLSTHAYHMADQGTDAEEREKSFYFASGQIAINPSVEETDAAGLGGFVSLLPGTVRVRAIHAQTGALVAEDNLLVEADVLTTVRLLPQ